jgi:nucleoside-diphosphate kinase
MTIERTLSIIKPDATGRNLTGEINTLIEKAGLRIIGQKRIRWTATQAQKFYGEHKGRPFFVVQVLEGKDAVATYRKIMGATDPAEAKRGTIRKRFAQSKGRNSVHGSDSTASAAREIALNFKTNEIVG